MSDTQLRYMITQHLGLEYREKKKGHQVIVEAKKPGWLNSWQRVGEKNTLLFLSYDRLTIAHLSGKLGLGLATLLALHSRQSAHRL